MRFGTFGSWVTGAAAIVVLGLAGAGCDSAGGSSTGGDLAIAGSYTDGYGGQHEIASDTWTQTSDFGDGPTTSLFHLTRFDNAAHWVVGQNDEANAYYPAKWSRFDWATAGGTLYFCQTTYDRDTEAQAVATPAANASDPANGGCGGFAWTALTPVQGQK